MDTNTTTGLARAMTALISLANTDGDAAKAVFDHIILEEQIAVRTAARVAAPVRSTFDTTTPINNTAGPVVLTPASPTSHKLGSQVMPQTLDVNNNTAADSKSKTCYLQVFPRSNTNTFAIDKTTSARFLPEIKLTPNKAIGNLLLSDSAIKKRKAAEDFTAAEAKKTKTAAEGSKAPATENTMSTIEEETEQLERNDKLAKLGKRHRWRRRIPRRRKLELARLQALDVEATGPLSQMYIYARGADMIVSTLVNKGASSALLSMLRRGESPFRPCQVATPLQIGAQQRLLSK